jgi:hypothetical protein
MSRTYQKSYDPGGYLSVDEPTTANEMSRGQIEHAIPQCNGHCVSLDHSPTAHRPHGQAGKERLEKVLFPPSGRIGHYLFQIIQYRRTPSSQILHFV